MREKLLKVNRGLFFFVLLTIVLYYGRPILVPLCLAILLAMLMAPLCRRLEERGWHRVASSALSVFVILLFFALAIGILAAQLSSFIRDISLIEHRTNELIATIQQYVEKKWGIPPSEQAELIKSRKNPGDTLLQPYLRTLFRSSLQTFAALVLTIILTFLFLYHRERYQAFFLRFTPGETREQKNEMLVNISMVSQRYLVGRAFSIIALFILYTIALVLIGINNALLLAGFAALFNIIPVIGPFFAAIIPFLVALVTEDSYQPAIWVLISFCVFQFIDNYYLTPHYLGGEVSLSAMSTIVIMICGGLTWGIAGMILFIPILSIAKIVFDYVPGLQHYSLLIGNPGKRPSRKLGEWFRKLTRK